MIVATMENMPQLAHTPPLGEHAADAEALARFAAGDRDALGELAARYERALLGLACGVLSGDESAARDAVQQTWLKVIRHAQRFEARSSVKTWLYRITINECRTLLRTGRAAVQQSECHRPDEETSLDDLRRAVGKLAPEEREILLLCYHQGMSRGQAAEVLDMPIGTLKTKLRAAKENLRAMLE